MNPDPQDAILTSHCRKHGEIEGEECSECYLEERRREMAQEVSDGMADTMKDIAVESCRGLVEKGRES